VDVQAPGKAGGGADVPGLACEFQTVCHLLHALGTGSKRCATATRAPSHPDRKAQFEHINTVAATFA